jgi:aspartate racemase
MTAMKTRTGVKTSAPSPLFSLPVLERFESDPGSVQRSVVGILGGMGPEATADFYLKLVRATPAARDQEHLRVLIWSDPTIPDRTEALLTHGADPTPALIAGARLLKKAGAGMLAVPCNTAHAFLKDVQAEVDIPVIHMIQETAEYVQQLSPSVQKVGLLSTTGTQKAGLYQSWLNRKGVTVITPDSARQDLVMDSIHAIKAGRSAAAVRPLFTEAALDLIGAGAQAIIGGCTEVPVGLSGNDIPVPFIDPAEILAAAVVRRVLGAK